MSEKPVRVRLWWRTNPLLPPLPKGYKLSRPARFGHQGEDWLGNAWSLSIEIQEERNEARDQFALAHFSAPDAPHEWLAPGGRFALFDGATVLAEGEIINP